MQFVFQPLAWGFLLVLLPLLIHLINLVRHRRTQWAAMEFLLESYRKLRRWVWLKQALLIASRMLAVAIAVAMLAQWVSGSRWLAMISQSTTHHYVILDDSASMSDTSSKGTAYQSALAAVQSIAANANTQEGSHLLTVVRTSQASLASTRTKDATLNATDSSTATKSASQAPQADSVAELLSRTIPTDPSSLLSKINSTTTTSLDSGPGDSLELIAPLLQQATSEKAIVYLMSDFRTKDWNNPALIKQQLQSLSSANTELQLIDCVTERHENLTLVSVLPQQEVLAAGVPAMINIAVRNNGIAPVRNATVRVHSVDYGNRQLEPMPTAAFSGLVTELPPVLIDRIEPGELVTRHVQVLFPKSGSHVVEAQLPPDSLNADNSARCVLDLQDGLRVLLIDGDSTGKHSFFFESALNPGGNAKTGLIMTREGSEFLRDSDLAAIQNYACIILQAVPSLGPRALENLHKYVSNGGGVAVFFGEQMPIDDYNKNWTKPIANAENATPLMPFTIKGPAELSQVAGDMKPDLIADNHPIFEPFFGLSNSPFQFVRIQRFLALERNLGESGTVEGRSTPLWKPVATLRNGQPILIDHSIGEGRVLFGLTAFDRQWTNWPQDPTFVVAALKMVGYLSSFRSPETARLAGTPMRWDFSSKEMLPEIQVLCPPPNGTGAKALLSLNALPAGESAFQATLNAQSNQDTDESIRAIMSAGNFEWWGTSIQGERIVKNIARNTPPAEGETEKTTLIDLNRNLNGVKFVYKSSDSLGTNTALAGFANRNMILMALLLVVLLFEQWLAWSASYHLPGGKR